MAELRFVFLLVIFYTIHAQTPCPDQPECDCAPDPLREGRVEKFCTKTPQSQSVRHVSVGMAPAPQILPTSPFTKPIIPEPPSTAQDISAIQKEQTMQKAHNIYYKEKGRKPGQSFTVDLLFWISDSVCSVFVAHPWLAPGASAVVAFVLNYEAALERLARKLWALFKPQMVLRKHLQHLKYLLRIFVGDRDCSRSGGGCGGSFGNNGDAFRSSSVFLSGKLVKFRM